MYRQLSYRRLAIILICAVMICLIIFRTQQIVQSERVELSPSPVITVLTPQGNCSQMELERFLIGVVAAEMPATFEPEALKAQAVAARSYIFRRLESAQGKHASAQICCDPNCCQAWLSDEQLRQNWGHDYAEKIQRIAAAVQSTCGETLTYNDAVIDAAFCSTCGGRSENADECWSNYVPYLQSTPCRWCAHSPRYASHLTLSMEQAADLLGCSRQQLADMQVQSYTAGGRVKELTLGGSSMKGTQLRSKLGLNSASFCWMIMGEQISFFSIGFGHGVGMCQYGADGMAREGNDYRQILAHYYRDTAITQQYVSD